MATNNLFHKALRGMATTLSRVPKSALWVVSGLELSVIVAFSAVWPPRPQDVPTVSAPMTSIAATGSASVQPNCIPAIESYTVRWQSMEPMIRDGAAVAVDTAYYRCGRSVERGDVVIYDSAATKGPVVKRVRALPGDAVSLKDGALSVNGTVLTNSAWTAYRFSAAESLMISIYAPDGRLQDGAYLVFGDNVGNSTDSRKYGAVRAKDFRGKVGMGK